MYYDYRLLCLRSVRQHSKSSIAQYGQTTRRINPECNQTLTEYCGKTETMEHLLCECENYSESLWCNLLIH
jgi:hypothetical protein